VKSKPEKPINRALLHHILHIGESNKATHKEVFRSKESKDLLREDNLPP
jgi:hypothetical protein